jgi:hypothetical protein
MSEPFWKNNGPDSIKIEVPGAGDIEISLEPNYTTGGVQGFSFGVSWGEYGYAGGVLSKVEARKLASHIMRKLNLEDLKLNDDQNEKMD